MEVSYASHKSFDYWNGGAVAVYEDVFGDRPIKAADRSSGPRSPLVQRSHHLDVWGIHEDQEVMSESNPAQTREPLRNVTKPSLPRVCEGQGCDQILGEQLRGRPAKYCSPTCRVRAHRERRRGPVKAEVHFGSASTRGRSEDHSWMVKLRRESEEMIVVIGQTRQGAQHLARRLNDFLN